MFRDWVDAHEILKGDMKARLVTITKTHVACPHCGKADGTVDHLFGSPGLSFGPWYCKSCGASYVGHTNTDGTVDIEPRDETNIDTADLLVLEPQSEPVYFIVRGSRVAKPGRTDDDDEHKRYYYESHSCPTNWLQPAEIMFGGDQDPHGLIKYVATRDFKDEKEEISFDSFGVEAARKALARP